LSSSYNASDREIYGYFTAECRAVLRLGIVVKGEKGQEGGRRGREKAQLRREVAS
jgi:hypothetical protein